MRFLPVLLLLVVSQNLRAQDLVSDSVLIDDHYRSFHYIKPAPGQVRSNLLFILHGSGGTGVGFRRNVLSFEPKAAAAGVLLVYPDGYKHYWNECRRYATSAANKENISEEKFFKVMIRYFSEKYGIRTDHIYAAGFSGGGHMAYKLGMQLPQYFRGIAAIVANLPTDASLDCTPQGKQLPVLIVNGTADNTNPYGGGEMFVDGQSYGAVRSTDSTLAYWAALAGYTGLPTRKKLPDADTTNNQWLETFTYDVADKPIVQLVKVNGGGHMHPADLDIYTYIWDFFARQQNRSFAVGKKNRRKPLYILDAACGICQFDMRGDDCALAVRVNGIEFYVEGTGIDDHGDAHAKEGFCNSIRRAEVQGSVVDGRFRVTYFKLVK
jgi:polyhydroxybutyrate depolymerase